MVWLWSGSSGQEVVDAIQKRNAIFNLLPGIDAVGNKKLQSQVFNQMQAMYDAEYNFIPKTFAIPEESAELKQYMSKHGKTFVVKPASGSEGCGIFLVKNFKSIQSYCFTQPHIV